MWKSWTCTKDKRVNERSKINLLEALYIHRCSSLVKECIGSNNVARAKVVIHTSA